MAIKDVELIDEYMLSLKPKIFNSIKSNKSLFAILTKEDKIEGEDDILPSDLIDACQELGIGFKTYVEEFNVIRITMEDNSSISLTNLDIGAVWDWHDYCEEMICSWHENFMMLAATDLKGQEGIMGIYDVSGKNWIYNESSPFMRGMIYAPEINKFVGLYDISTWGKNECGIVILDPEKDFSREDIVFEAHGEGSDKGEQNNSYRYDEIETEMEKDEVIGTEIDRDTMLLWDGAEKCVYVKMKDKGYRYCAG